MLDVALAFALTIASSAGESVSRTWSMQVVSSQKVEFRISADYDAPGHHSRRIDDETYVVPDFQTAFRGLTMAQLNAPDSAVHFEIVHQAGTFVCDGVARNGSAVGTFDERMNPSFVAELQRRGIAPPAPDQQERLIFQTGDLIGLLDALREGGHDAPNVDDLIRLSNHGVTPAFVRAVTASGLRGLPVEDMVRLTDHGVAPRYLAGLRDLGYHVDARDAERLADHGVTLDFVRHLHSLGYTNLSPAELIRLRDHGVN